MIFNDDDHETVKTHDHTQQKKNHIFFLPTLKLTRFIRKIFTSEKKIIHI